MYNLTQAHCDKLQSFQMVIWKGYLNDLSHHVDKKLRPKFDPRIKNNIFCCYFCKKKFAEVI